MTLLDPDNGDARWAACASLVPERTGNWQRIERTVRGEGWVFLANLASGHKLRLDLNADRVLQAIDGQRSLQAILERLHPEANADERANLLHTLAVLSHHGLARAGALNDTALQLARAERSREQRKRSRFGNPLVLRFDLLDPDRLLERLMPLARWMFNRISLLLWMILVGSAAVVALDQFEVFQAQMQRLAESPKNIWFLLVVYPVLKAAHEVAHALAVKRWGGSVHAMGITLLVLMPIPHVDAGDSWMIAERRRRMIIDAAGMAAELALASLALFYWMQAEPGILRDLAFSMMLTGSVVTVLFNANPLLRFDGYHILQDAIEIPNLAQRSTLYWRFLVRRHIFKLEQAESPLMHESERVWLLGYALASSIYRFILTFGIAFFLAGRFPFVGALLGAYAVARLILWPLLQLIQYLSVHPELQGRRGEAWRTVLLPTVLLLVVLTAIPFSASTRVNGVVQVPQQSALYAPDDAILAEQFVEAGADVRAGTLIFRLESETLLNRLATLDAEVETLKLDLAEARIMGDARWTSLREQLRLSEQERARVADRVGALEVRAPNDGRLALASDEYRPGVRLEQGALYAWVVEAGSLEVRAVADQNKLAQLRHGTRAIRVRLAERFDTVYPATLLREIPEADHALPSASMAWDGHGGIAVARSDDGQLRALEPVFQMDLRLPDGVPACGIGGRAYVTIEHERQILVVRAWMALRQLLMSRLSL